MPDVPVAAVNAFTARWAATLPDEGTALSGAGVFPLLAILADAADEGGRAQLGAAVGGSGTADARAVLALLDASPGLRGALGLWTREDLVLRPEWLDTLPPGIGGALSGDPAADRARLDAWARERTGGLIERMPVTVDATTLLVLASALAVETSWAQPFTAPHRDEPGSGGWTGIPVALMTRVTHDPSAVRASESLTVVRVEGDAGIDVHLALGARAATAAEVLSAAITAGELTPGDALPPDTEAPGVTFAKIPSFNPDRSVALAVPAFTVRGSHDLTAQPDLFGLGAATDGSRGHFPVISDTPLYVAQARQDAMAEFTHLGFRAAAVTGVAMAMGAAMPTSRAWQVRVRLDRPFGFVAVHRASGLVLAAGWVTRPDAMADRWSRDARSVPDAA